MTTENRCHAGRTLLAIALFFIGVVHLVFGVFPVGLEPIAGNLATAKTLAYTCGLLTAAAALMVLIRKFSPQGIVLLIIIYTIDLLLMQLPKALSDPANAGIWTGFFEVLALLGGMLLVAGREREQQGYILIKTGRYLLIISLLVFGSLHIKYASYIVTLIPAWFPLKPAANVIVIIGFLGAATSFIIQKKTGITSLLLSAMFMVWFIILHIPRCIATPASEPEWTSACVALAMSGIALLTASGLTKAVDAD